MESHALNRFRRHVLAASGARGVLPSPASLQHASELDRQFLRTARERCERQVRWGRQSMLVGLVLGPAALVLACCVEEPSVRWLLVIASALELGFVPFYTSLACRRLRYVIALIDVDLEEGLVEEGSSRVRRWLGVWPVLEDANTPRVRFAPAGVNRFRGFRPGASVTYRFAARSRVVVWIDRGERVESNRSPEDARRGHHQMGRPSPLERHQTPASCCRWPACLT